MATYGKFGHARRINKGHHLDGQLPSLRLLPEIVLKKYVDLCRHTPI